MTHSKQFKPGDIITVKSTSIAKGEILSTSDQHHTGLGFCLVVSCPGSNAYSRIVQVLTPMGFLDWVFVKCFIEINDIWH